MALLRCEKSTYSNDLSPNERKRSLGHNSPPTQEPALDPRKVIVLDEWTRILPVAKAESIMVRATSEIEYDTKNDKALK
jgi:hypothetical protein